MRRKAQSAMEYLMTYGWAILIIAVVLGALFQLGVFNSGTFAPKAPPGACQVFRPDGPGTATNINFEGICNGELPQYVGVFNGQSSYISIPSSTYLNFGGSVTLTAWITFNSYAFAANSLNVFSPSSCTGSNYLLRIGGNAGNSQYLEYVEPCLGAYTSSPYTVPLNTWVFVATSFTNGNNILFAVDSQQRTVSTSMTLTALSGVTYEIGYDFGGGYFSGDISNVQVYNTSLSANEIQALYLEGIGGAPVRPQNIVGWWPLNGNSNDYSGNGNNGAPNGLTYTNQWLTGYTPP